MAELSEKAVGLIEAKNFGNLATIRPDGTPNVTPVWVDWDGESVLINTAAGRAKERHLRRDPRATISVFQLDNPYNYVAVTGRAELTEEGADEHIDRLAKKYLDQDSYPFRQPGEQRVIVRIWPERVNEYWG
jgi:PPOX class probable F420-dependent enzyme